MFKIIEDPNYDEDGNDNDDGKCPASWFDVVPPASEEELEEILRLS